MSVPTWSAVLGTLAALLTTLAFLPQLAKVRRQGGGDLSSSMLAMYLIGQGLWLAYGLLNRAGAVIGANVASIILVAAVAVMKSRARRSAAVRPRRLRIAIDMDEVMADAVAEHLRRYNTAFGARLAIDDLHGRHLEEFVPPEHRATAEAMLDSTFFEQLAVLPDCQDVIRELTLRHEVFIVTAAMEVPCSFDAKYHWLRRYFAFIPSSNIVFCGDKGVIDADYLIDDRARHFLSFKGRPLLFSAPHNAGETRYPRVSSWAEVREVFARPDTDSLSRTPIASGERNLLTGVAARS